MSELIAKNKVTVVFIVVVVLLIAMGALTT